jgi:uncharacterized protein
VIIDAHVHLQGSVFSNDHRPSDVAQLVAAMNEAGIDRAVVLGLSDTVTNESLLAACALFPSRLTPFVLELPSSANLQNIPQYVTAGARGMGEIYVNPGSKETLSVYLAPLISVARSNHLPLLLHTGDFSYTAPLLTAGLIRTNPDINFILGHMGSFHYALDAIEILKTYPNAFADTSGLTSPLMLQRAAAECGADKLFFGSDYPFWHPQVELQRIYVADLGKEAEKKILGENIARLLKI